MLNLVGGGGGGGNMGSMGHSQQARLFVGDLKNAEKADIESAFSPFGRIKEIWMAHNPPGFAFVEFFERESALKAMEKMNGSTIKGDKLRVEFSKNRKGVGGFGGNNSGTSPFLTFANARGPNRYSQPGGVSAPGYYNARGGLPHSAGGATVQGPPPIHHYQYPPPFAAAPAPQASPFASGPLGGRPPSPSMQHHLPPGATLADYHHGQYANAAAAAAMYAPYGMGPVDGTSPIGATGPAPGPHYAPTASPNDYYQAAAAAHLKLQQAQQQQQQPQGPAGAARLSIEEYDRYYRAAAAALAGQQPPPPSDIYGQAQAAGAGATGASYAANGGPPMVNDYREYYLATTDPQQQLHHHKRYPDDMGQGGGALAPHYAAHHMESLGASADDPYGLRYKYHRGDVAPVSDDYERYLRSLYPPPPGATMHHNTSPTNGGTAPGGRKYSATSRYRTASPSPPKGGGGFRGGRASSPTGGARGYSPGEEGRSGGRREESPPQYRYYDPYYDSYYRDYRHQQQGHPSRPGAGSPPPGSTGSVKGAGGAIPNPSTGAGYHGGEYHHGAVISADAGGNRTTVGEGGAKGGPSASTSARQIKNGGVLVTARRDTNERGTGDYYYDNDKGGRGPLAVHDSQRR